MNRKIIILILFIIFISGCSCLKFNPEKDNCLKWECYYNGYYEGEVDDEVDCMDGSDFICTEWVSKDNKTICLKQPFDSYS